MAGGLPLTTFRNVPYQVTDNLVTVYTAPLGITSIVLMAQVSNVDVADAVVTFVHVQHRSPGLTTRIVKDMVVPTNDSRILLGGKLVLESLDRIQVQADRVGALEFMASVLESANQ